MQIATPPPTSYIYYIVVHCIFTSANLRCEMRLSKNIFVSFMGHHNFGNHLICFQGKNFSFKEIDCIINRGSMCINVQRKLTSFSVVRNHELCSYVLCMRVFVHVHKWDSVLQLYHEQLQW